MRYRSTRGGGETLTASQAILKGLADDGGLFMPDRLPILKRELRELSKLSYQELALEVMREFLTDYTDAELKRCINAAYDKKFDTPEIAPIRKADDAYFLELFHGKTIAFKDMALSILPHLMTTAAKKNGVSKKIVILTATSGDTGKAAMEGFADVPGTEIIVFYPKNGVSKFQELQMRTQRGANTHVAAIEGNFDDAQTGVKNIFGDQAFAQKLAENGIQLSSANSINIGRLVPQVVYYVYAYCKLLASGEIQDEETLNVCVPTGNFGNILAAWFAKQMGVPFGKLICASNENRVLADFFASGAYDKNRPFILTTSPSMDILVSSNLERLIYLSCGCNADVCRACMESLKETGRYTVTQPMRSFMSDFSGGYALEASVFGTINALEQKTGYVIDPHTAVAKSVYDAYRRRTGDYTKTVIASTASPFKFAPTVMKALGSSGEAKDVFGLIDELSSISGVPEPAAIEEVRNAKIRHNTECAAADMEKTVAEFLGIH